MRIHERESVVHKAERDIAEAVLPLIEELTPWETVRVLNNAFSALLGGVAKYELRFERHGNYDEEGGLA